MRSKDRAAALSVRMPRSRLQATRRCLALLPRGDTKGVLARWLVFAGEDPNHFAEPRQPPVRQGLKADQGGRHGAPWLKASLVQIAWPATRKKDSYFRVLFHRLKARRGPKKAIVAVAASILTTVYHLLRDGTLYQDLGPGHFDSINRDRAAHSLVRRLKALGFDVGVRPPAA